MTFDFPLDILMLRASIEHNSIAIIRSKEIDKRNKLFQAICVAPEPFKAAEGVQLGFMITKPIQWLEEATSAIIQDATAGNKIVRITEKLQDPYSKFPTVKTVMYIVSLNFYTNRMGMQLNGEQQ